MRQRNAKGGNENRSSKPKPHVLMAHHIQGLKTDDATRARWISTFAKKGDAKADIKQFTASIHTQYGKYPKSFRLNNGTEYGGKEFKDYCTERGIRIEPTVPYTPEQDGVAERANRTILDRCRTLISALAENEDDEGP